MRLGHFPLLGPRAVRPFNRRKRTQSSPSFNFQIDNVCLPGQTLLWDLIQDDKIVRVVTVLRQVLAV